MVKLRDKRAARVSRRVQARGGGGGSSPPSFGRGRSARDKGRKRRLTRYKCTYVGDNGRENNRWRYGERKISLCHAPDTALLLTHVPTTATISGYTFRHPRLKVNDPRSRSMTHLLYRFVYVCVFVCLFFNRTRNKSGHIGHVGFIFHFPRRLTALDRSIPFFREIFP